MSKILTSAIVGLNGALVEVESDIANGLPAFSLVGLPDASVKESKDRVISAIKNSGFDFPTTKVTVNLAPADIRKESTAYDLPIAISILITKGKLNEPAEPVLILGELSLNGALRPISGAIFSALLAKEKGIKKIILPKDNEAETAAIAGAEVYGMENLRDAVEFLRGEKTFEPCAPGKIDFDLAASGYDCDFAFIKGQEQAKYALEVASAGGHNILLSGPPGSGKTLLAQAMPSILPKMTFDEALQVSKIHSVAGLLSGGAPLILRRPFRSPHHTASSIALIGGGASIRPGEISLAHRGVLFLDEFPEFHRDVLEALRQPLEDGMVTVSRAAGTCRYPAKFILLAAKNPCPCGYLGDPKHSCNCSPANLQKYQKKLSGPLLDRIDLHVEAPAIEIEKLQEKNSGEPSSAVRARVEAARNIQLQRFKEEGIIVNGEMGNKLIEKYCALSAEAKEKLKTVCDFYNLSARSYHRLLKVARTVADLAAEENVGAEHIAQAAQFRMNQG